MHDLATLQNDLKEFGLNPSDWNLLPTAQEEYLILSKQDPEFILKGRIENQISKRTWGQLELIEFG